VRGLIFFAAFAFFLTISCQKSEEEQSVDFLKTHMGDKFSSEKKVISNLGVIIPFSPYSFETLYQASDSLEQLIKKNQVFTGFYKDSECIADSFIHKHVEMMLRNKTKYSVLKHIGTDIFYEFILPYRGGDEISSDYHSTIEKLFGKVVEDLPENAKTLKKVVAINSELIKTLDFDLRSHALLKEPDILEVLHTGKGSCNSLTATTAQIMRFFGVPTAIDECPVWAHRNSGHRWNAFLGEDVKWIPFAGAETNPDEFNVINDSVKAPKVFRHTFSPQKGFQPPINNLNDIPPIFHFANRIDVTNQYVSTSDVEVYPDMNMIGKDSIVYLAVFNAEEWRIVSWAKIENGKAIFRKIGNNNIIYLPVCYENRQTTPVAKPFILTPGSMINIIPDTIHKTKLELKYHNIFFDFKWNIGITSQGRKTELYYWDNKWVLCGNYETGKDHVLRFSEAPQNALFWIKSNEWDNTWQRIFTFENGEQIWF
jgi:hypothetical protein